MAAISRLRYVRLPSPRQVTFIARAAAQYERATQVGNVAQGGDRR